MVRMGSDGVVPRWLCAGGVFVFPFVCAGRGAEQRDCTLCEWDVTGGRPGCFAGNLLAFTLLICHRC